MNPLPQKYGNWALIAGAAEGVGEGFSWVLAESGINIIMVDYNGEAMKNLADNILRKFNVEIIMLKLDLGQKDAAAQCLKIAGAYNARLLIYVAAYSRVQPFSTLEGADIDNFIDINCRTLTHLVHGFSNRLIQDCSPGGIILIASLAGLIGPQYVATYAATKAFIIRLAEATSNELAKHGIDIMACTLGTISTPAFWRSQPTLGLMKPSIMTPLKVAELVMPQLGKKLIFMPGLTNRLQYFFMQNLLPRTLARKLINSVIEKMYGKQINTKW